MVMATDVRRRQLLSLLLPLSIFVKTSSIDAFVPLYRSCHARNAQAARRSTPHSLVRRTAEEAAAAPNVRDDDDHDDGYNGHGEVGNVLSRRDAIRSSAALTLSAGLGLGTAASLDNHVANAALADDHRQQQDAPDPRRTYRQRFPAPFDPIYGPCPNRPTIKRQMSRNIWALEQSLVLGPLETPLRCVVVKLKDGTLWVHAPLAPTIEFFELVESCADADNDGAQQASRAGNAVAVSHVVIPTYALEHKIFARDALERWPNAKLWTSPGQFTFPLRSVPDEYVWGRKNAVNGVLRDSDLSVSNSDVPWIDEIEFETLAAGTFNVGSSPITFYETVFYHKADRTLIVTDCVAQVPLTPPPLNSPANLLLVSKRSTSDPMPADTPESRQVGWEKTSLLVSYFFPEHEELDPDAGFGVVTWTEGWHDNFRTLAGRLLVPPVVRTLIYAQNPAEVRRWVDRVVTERRWDFDTIVPAHWEAPIRATPAEFRRAFAFLEDDAVDAFPEKDLERGLRPIADVALRKLAR